MTQLIIFFSTVHWMMILKNYQTYIFLLPLISNLVSKLRTMICCTHFCRLRLWKSVRYTATEKSVRMCPSVCLSLASDSTLGNNWSYHHQPWHGNCLRHANASRVNYSYWPWSSLKVTQSLIMKIIFSNCPSNPHQVCWEDSLNKGLYNLCSVGWPCSFTQGHNCVSNLTIV